MSRWPSSTSTWPTYLLVLTCLGIAGPHKLLSCIAVSRPDHFSLLWMCFLLLGAPCHAGLTPAAYRKEKKASVMLADS
jgi:hypothetical protein